MMKLKGRNFSHFLQRNKLIILLFLSSTSFFLYQHKNYWSWDFSAYFLNAEYWLNDGNYFEWYRPPLTPLLLGIFGILNWKLSEYLYIIFVSTLFTFSCLKFGKVFVGKDPTLFYALMLSPFLLSNGLFAGTELLSLTFLLLFLSYFQNPVKSGINLALSCLTKYTNFSVLLSLIFYRNLRKVFIFILTFILLLLPWLLFNYLIKGHSLTSIGNSYAMNIKYRDYIHQGIDLSVFLKIVNVYLPFFLIGLYLKLKKIDRKTLLILLISLLTLFSFFSIPIKDERYLFNLALTIPYFSIFGLYHFKSKKLFKVLRIFFLIFPFISILYLSFNLEITHLEMYKKIAEEADDCMIQSNRWVILNYFGATSEPLSRGQLLQKKLDEGYHIIIFKNEEGFENLKALNYSKNFVKKENESFIWLKDERKCKEKHKVDSTYLERLHEQFPEIDPDPCKALLPSLICEKFKFL